MNFVFRRTAHGTVAVLAMVALAACGVRSAPDQPPESKYPRVYPAPDRSIPSGETETRRPTAAGRNVRPRTTGGNDGEYQPPPPATEMLAQ